MTEDNSVYFNTHAEGAGMSNPITRQICTNLANGYGHGQYGYKCSHGYSNHWGSENGNRGMGVGQAIDEFEIVTAGDEKSCRTQCEAMGGGAYNFRVTARTCRCYSYDAGVDLAKGDFAKIRASSSWRFCVRLPSTTPD